MIKRGLWDLGWVIAVTAKRVATFTKNNNKSVNGRKVKCDCSIPKSKIKDSTAIINILSYHYFMCSLRVSTL